MRSRVHAAAHDHTCGARFGGEARGQTARAAVDAPAWAQRGGYDFRNLSQRMEFKFSESTIAKQGRHCGGCSRFDDETTEHCASVLVDVDDIEMLPDDS